MSVEVAPYENAPSNQQLYIDFPIGTTYATSALQTVKRTVWAFMTDMNGIMIFGVRQGSSSLMATNAFQGSFAAGHIDITSVRIRPADANVKLTVGTVIKIYGRKK